LNDSCDYALLVMDSSINDRADRVALFSTLTKMET